VRRLAATTPADVLNELANFIKKISENFHEWCLRVSRDVWMHSSVGGTLDPFLNYAINSSSRDDAIIVEQGSPSPSTWLA